MNKRREREILSLQVLAGFLLFLTISVASIIAFPAAYAEDDSVDEIDIIVPASCTLSGVGMGTHNATIENGQFAVGIGTTTLKAFCNDNNGFSIYAIGYTDNTDGKNVLTDAGLNADSGTNYDIITGTTMSGATSQWAMKLSTPTNPTPTYPINIENNFNEYHTVPDDYTLVAKRMSSTDVGTNAEGSTLTTTYEAYVSPTQPAGTYVGQVKYVLVHPATAPVPVGADKIGVVYNANGSTFTGGATSNNVTYAVSPMHIATTPTFSKSANVLNDGTQNGAYYTGNEISTLDPITLTGADKIKVVLRYGLTMDSGEVLITEGNWDGDSDLTGTYYDLYPDSSNISGTNTYVFDGDTITIAMWAWDTPETGYDYGYFAEIYLIYTTEQSGTELTDEFAAIAADTGTYSTTTDWYGSWYADINGSHYDFTNETEVISFLENNASTLSGTTIDLYRGLTFDEAYAKANKTQTSGYYSQQDLNKNICQTVAIGQNSTVKDTRDNNTYMIGRLEDGNCWMLDNLALDPTDPTTAANMNASNTNATQAAINNLLNGGNSGNAGWSSTAIADVDTNFHNGFTVPRINNASKDTLVTSYGPAATNGQAKVGIYYNYCAASAGTYCYELGQGVDLPDAIIDAPQDLCPANWRMPTGGYDTGEYQALYNKYNTTMDATSPNSLQYNLSTPLSGIYFILAEGQGDWGYWWSSTYSYGHSMYILYVDSSDVYPSDGSRDNGYSMRCLIGD